MGRTLPEQICRNASLHAATAFDERSLHAAGSTGDVDHVVRVAAGIDLPLELLPPRDIVLSPCYVQGRFGEPDPAGVRFFPGAGLACLDFLDLAASALILNGLGGYRATLGSSHLFDQPIPDPGGGHLRFTIPGSATVDFPPGTKLTLQGLQYDGRTPESQGFAVTNAVIVEFE